MEVACNMVPMVAPPASNDNSVLNEDHEDNNTFHEDSAKLVQHHDQANGNIQTG